MTTFLESAKQYEIKENKVVDDFVAALKKQLAALEADKLNRRSWVKEHGEGYEVKLGKLEQRYFLPNKADAKKFLRDAISAAASEDDLIQAITTSHSAMETTETPKSKRGRKPKNA